MPTHQWNSWHVCAFGPHHRPALSSIDEHPRTLTNTMYHVGKSHFHSDCLVYQNELIVRKAWHLYQDATIERQPRASEWVIARPSDRASERSSERATERPSDRATERLKINITRIPEIRCRVWGKQNINFISKKVCSQIPAAKCSFTFTLWVK